MSQGSINYELEMGHLNIGFNRNWITVVECKYLINNNHLIDFV